MRKVAVFSDGDKKNINCTWVDGCRQYITENHLDVVLDVFTCFGNINPDKRFNVGEYNIYQLPDLREYDGVIVELTNTIDAELKEDILWKVRNSSLPAVSIYEEIAGLYYAGEEAGNLSKVTRAYRAMIFMEKSWYGESSSESNSALVYPIKQASWQDDEDMCIDYEVLSLKQALKDCNTFADVSDCLPAYLRRIGCRYMKLCLNPEIADCEKYLYANAQGDEFVRVIGYPKEMNVIMDYQNDDMTRKGDVLQRGDINLFLPIHFRDQEAGYLSLGGCTQLQENRWIYEIHQVLLDELQNLYQRITIHYLNESLLERYLFDNLTGIYNKLAYNRYALQIYQKCMEKEIPLAIMYVDVENIKHINDRYGHDMGNLAIKTIAVALSGQLAEDAQVFRYGGDEFVALIPNYNEERIEQLVKKTQLHIEKVSKALNLGFSIKATIGSVLAKDPTKTLSEYVAQADHRRRLLQEDNE